MSELGPGSATGPAVAHPALWSPHHCPARQAEDVAAGRLIEIQVPELDLRRVLRAIWDSTPDPPAGPARDLIGHILSRRRGPGARHAR